MQEAGSGCATPPLIALILTHHCPAVAGMTPLHIAAAEGRPHAITALVQGGASLLAADRDGDTALSWAALRGQVPALQQLLAAAERRGQMQECLTASNSSGRTALDMALAYSQDGTAAVLSDPAAATAAAPFPLPASLPQPRPVEEEAALRSAAKQNDVRALERLLDGGASVAQRSEDGTTLLHEAAAESATAAIELLLARGASLAALDNLGQTPLQRAALGE